MSLRIGYLIPEFPGQTHVFFWREIEALRKMGEEVRLLSTRKPSPITCRHEFVDRAVAETHYVFPPPFSAGASWLFGAGAGIASAGEYLAGLKPAGWKLGLKRSGLLISAIGLASWAAREKIDHIHGHSCADAAHLLALCRRLGGPPYSLTLHGDLGVYGTDHRSKMERAAFVFAVGSHLRRQILEQVGLAEDRVRVTCMGVDTSRLAALGAGRSFQPGSLHLATVARLNAMKGHTHALAAIRKAVDAGVDLRYTIAGEGPHQEVIVTRIRELGLESRVTLAGTLSEGEVLDLLARVDAFLLPSTGAGEAWPVSIMEAMACGLPVVSSIIGATPEMITSGEDGLLIAQADEAAIAEALQKLARDVDLRRRLGENARRTAQRRFDVQVTAAVLRDAIRSGLASSDQNRTPAVR